MRNLYSNKQKGLLKDDKVRKQYESKVFDKSYHPNWTDEIFDIDQKVSQPVKPVYKFKNTDKRYYPEQIQKVKENEYRIEKIIKKRKRKRKTECFVKCLNYPSSYNSWISIKDIHKL